MFVNRLLGVSILIGVDAMFVKVSICVAYDEGFQHHFICKMGDRCHQLLKSSIILLHHQRLPNLKKSSYQRFFS
ncbi:hypothetical protein Csa_006976 [Cucumis sativus]|nr:hypothetical protein Csa_006976 [Cucumis sativus]